MLQFLMYQHRRRQLQKVYGHLYKPVELADNYDRHYCFYCGEPASTVDHQPPLSLIEEFLDSNLGFECCTVPCCFECNDILSNYPSETLAERFQEHTERFRRRYRKRLRQSGQWDESELAELGFALAQMITAGQSASAITEQRLIYPGHRLEETTDLWHFPDKEKGQPVQRTN
jgi:hypothetical protein